MKLKVDEENDALYFLLTKLHSGVESEGVGHGSFWTPMPTTSHSSLLDLTMPLT